MDLMFCHEFARQSFPLRASVTSAHNDLEFGGRKTAIYLAKMSSPRSRAQSSSASIPPDYVTGSGIDAHAIEVRSKLHPFAQKNLDENVLHLFENTLVLGPHWFGPVPAEVAELLRKDAEAPLCFESTSALASHSWVSKNLSRSFPSSEVRNSPVKWADWIDRLLPRYGGHWRRAGIYDAILLSKQSINRDENLLAAALCFWNSASNTFDFRVGPMAPTLLDMAQIFGFRPHGRPVDAVGDYHRRKNQEKVTTPFTISPATINQNCSFSNYLKRFGTEKDKDQQHMLFLLYWLNRFVFPNRSSAVLLEYRHLAEALHNHTDVYFPELRFPDVVLPENQVLALPLISAEVPKRSLEEYLMLFRHCTKRSAAQWQVVIRRTYPWFQAGFRLFEKEPEDEAARTDFRKKFLSITLPRDLPHGGGKPPNYHLGAEVYHPNFCARQLGCPQLIPLKSYRSCNRASSWRDADDLEVHKDARTDALYPSWEPNSCSSADFDAWWQARFQNLPASVTALKTLFDGWENWHLFAEGEAKAHMIQTIKEINAQIIEDPSLTKNVGGQSVQAGEVIGRTTPAEAVPSGRRKRKGPGIPAGSPSPPPTKLKKLKKKGEVEYFAAEEPQQSRSVLLGRMTSCEKLLRRWSRKKSCKSWRRCPKESGVVEDEDEIPAEVIAESIALAQKQQKGPGAELTSSELALFEDAEAEHSTAAPEAEDRVEPSVSDPVDQAELTMPIHSFPGSSATASFADPELEEFEAMDLDAQLDKLEKLSSPPSKAKPRAVQEAMERLKIWQFH
ncbi:autoinhibited Ca2+-ATPase 11 [Prunus dulcis]|uniref:Autoinhibited Ca2+-ATPase 11 n=2 Tax=Prunus dulcis TaxID=3755 RepID=A0A4Y1RMF5_PRUDU|nr:autoinhibited Ca2+-ATPase 11 [Prunus dulcis]